MGAAEGVTLYYWSWGLAREQKRKQKWHSSGKRHQTPKMRWRRTTSKVTKVIKCYSVILVCRAIGPCTKSLKWSLGEHCNPVTAGVGNRREGFEGWEERSAFFFSYSSLCLPLCAATWPGKQRLHVCLSWDLISILGAWVWHLQSLKSLGDNHSE